MLKIQDIPKHLHIPLGAVAEGTVHSTDWLIDPKDLDKWNVSYSPEDVEEHLAGKRVRIILDKNNEY